MSDLRRWASVDPGPFRFGTEAKGADPFAWLEDLPLRELRAIRDRHRLRAWRSGELSDHELRCFRESLWVHRPALVLDALEPGEREELRVDEPRKPTWRRYAESARDWEARK